MGLGENPTKRYKSEALRVKHTGFRIICALNEKDWFFCGFSFEGLRVGLFGYRSGFFKGTIFGY